MLGLFGKKKADRAAQKGSDLDRAPLPESTEELVREKIRLQEEDENGNWEVVDRLSAVQRLIEEKTKKALAENPRDAQAWLQRCHQGSLKREEMYACCARALQYAPDEKKAEYCRQIEQIVLDRNVSIGTAGLNSLWITQVKTNLQKIGGTVPFTSALDSERVKEYENMLKELLNESRKFDYSYKINQEPDEETKANMLYLHEQGVRIDQTAQCERYMNCYLKLAGLYDYDPDMKMTEGEEFTAWFNASVQMGTMLKAACYAYAQTEETYLRVYAEITALARGRQQAPEYTLQKGKYVAVPQRNSVGRMACESFIKLNTPEKAREDYQRMHSRK